ncbi:MAG: hypothetical protein JXR96_12810 [Deltaproteobacteria bacterium]|nr:hypothetical protein [Deltaproteobacteria bacterium]
MSSERRDSYRFGVEGQACLASSCGKKIQVSNIGAGGSGLVIPEGGDASFEKSLAIRLSDDLVLEARVAPAWISSGPPVRIGVRFCDIGREAMTALTRFLIERNEERSRRLPRLAALEPAMWAGRQPLLQDLLSYYLLRCKRRLAVYQQDRILPVELEVLRMTTESARRCIVTQPVWGDEKQFEPGASLAFSFEGTSALCHFQTAIWRVAPGIVVLLLPDAVRQVAFRRSPRVWLPDGQRIELLYRSQRVLEGFVRKTLIEVSGHGLAFEVQPDVDLLFPGERLGQVLVVLPGGLVEIEAAVRSLYRRQGLDGFVCGLQILGFASEKMRLMWERYVFAHAYPEVGIGRVDDVDLAWELLVSSKYVDEATPGLRGPLTQKYLESWRRHTKNDRLGHFIIVEHTGLPASTAAGSLLYPRTWLVHQFGIDERTRKQDRRAFFDVARRTYKSMQHLLANIADIDFIVIYADASLRWNRLTYTGFLERYPHPQECLYDEYQVFKHHLESVPELPGEGCEVYEADDADRRAISAHLARSLPAIETEAYCYGPDEIALDGFTADCERLGYERARRILVARDRSGVRRAAAIVETGEEGVNIFGLLNKCWLVYLSAGRSDDSRAAEALLGAAVMHYRREGKPEFIFIRRADGPARETLEALGFEYVAPGMRFLVRQSALPAWMSYCEECMGMIDG